jgi:hypothetical protein
VSAIPTVEATSKQRAALRRTLGIRNQAVPVILLIGGSLSPHVTGSRGGHFTRGGSRIYHPSAYSRRGWSNMVYRCDTRRIYVGQRWLAAHC